MPKHHKHTQESTDLNLEVLKVLNEIKKNNNISFQEIQERSVEQRMSRSVVCRYFNGENKMDVITFIEICNILRTNPANVIALAELRLKNIKSPIDVSN